MLTAYGNYLFNDLKLMAGYDSFFSELDHFSDAKYREPNGIFMIFYADCKPAGCAGIRRFDGNSCEFKRMFLKDSFRGIGFAAQMIAHMLNKAKELGYNRVLLDSDAKMAAAVKAYLKAGFKLIPPYCENDKPDPVFMAYKLS